MVQIMQCDLGLTRKIDERGSKEREGHYKERRNPVLVRDIEIRAHKRNNHKHRRGNRGECGKQYGFVQQHSATLESRDINL
jgi:hypothetical protein